MRRLLLALCLSACAAPPPKAPAPALDVVQANPEDPKFIPSAEQVRRAEIEAAPPPAPPPPEEAPPDAGPAATISGGGITTFYGGPPEPARKPKFEQQPSPMAPATTTASVAIPPGPTPARAGHTFAKPDPRRR